MKSRDVKLARLTRWKTKKSYSDRLTNLYWRYCHQVHGNLNQTGAW